MNELSYKSDHKRISEFYMDKKEDNWLLSGDSESIYPFLKKMVKIIDLFLQFTY